VSQKIFSSVLPLASAHIANSSYTASLVKKLNSKLDVVAIPYGSSIPLAVQAPVQKSADEVKLLFVGRHIERKGISYLIEAMQKLPQNYSLTIVGEGDQTEALKKQAAGDARITFAGRLSSDALAATYATHDIFVLPAIVDSKGDTEGLGVVLLEAVAAGLPVVASAVGGIVDVVQDGQTGLLVAQKDSTALAAAIARLHAEPCLAERLRTNATVAAKEYFDWEQITQRTLALYNKVITEAKR
jgi:glycosyltransferase involved in cell wall biosynthesis